MSLFLPVWGLNSNTYNIPSVDVKYVENKERFIIYISDSNSLETQNYISLKNEKCEILIFLIASFVILHCHYGIELHVIPFAEEHHDSNFTDIQYGKTHTCIYM